MSAGVINSIKILELLAINKNGLSFSYLCSELKTTNSTTSRLLSQLVHLEWCRKNELGLYIVGEKFISAAYELNTQEKSLEKLLCKTVNSLAVESGQSAAFAIPDRNAFSFLCKKEIPESYLYIDINTLNFSCYNIFWQKIFINLDQYDQKKMLACARGDTNSFPHNIPKREASVHIDNGRKAVEAIYYNDQLLGALGVSFYDEELDCRMIALVQKFSYKISKLLKNGEWNNDL